MKSRSANLVIMFTDIVGFTSATATQSRQQNESLIDSHNSLLLPILHSFQGEHVKSIGDSLLCVFQSPTDALLCAMAMQDQLFGHNRNLAEPDQIRIRIALSLGEVRVTENDVFGDAVNVASRIESITPQDEIYFSEAVFMTMNKAEVAAEALGEKELPGVSDPIEIYQIPRFTSPALTADRQSSTEDVPVAFPFGGAHLRIPLQPDSVKKVHRYGWKAAAAICLLVALFAGIALIRQKRITRNLRRNVLPESQPQRIPGARPMKAIPPEKRTRPLPEGQLNRQQEVPFRQRDQPLPHVPPNWDRWKRQPPPGMPPNQRRPGAPRHPDRK